MACSLASANPGSTPGHARLDEGAQLDIVCSVAADRSAAAAARII